VQPPTVDSLVEAAIVSLLALPAADLHAAAIKHKASCYPDDDINVAMTVKATFPTPATLRDALVAREPVARRSAMFLLTAVDPASAWPLVKPFVAETPPAKAKGLNVVSHLVPWIVGSIPSIPFADLVALCDNPRVNTQALVGSTVAQRKTPAERLSLLEHVLSSELSDGSWILANALEVALAPGSRAKLIEMLRGPVHESWQKWVGEKLLSLRDEARLREVASGLDPKKPHALNAAVALRPGYWHEVETRFFSPKALRTKAGRTLAASILHSVHTEVSLRGQKTWKKARPFVAFVDSLADPEGDALAYTAASLARILRGKHALAPRA
jgi:hypothetical protein